MFHPRKAYQLVRMHRQPPNVFRPDEDCLERARETLLHAELLVLGGDDDDGGGGGDVWPPWFAEDLMLLFHLTEPERLHVFDGQQRRHWIFQVRVFWLHCHWNRRQKRIEAALNHLNRVRAEGLTEFLPSCYCWFCFLFGTRFTIA